MATVERSFTEVVKEVQKECNCRQTCTGCILNNKGCRFRDLVCDPRADINLNFIFELFGQKEV